MTRVISDTAVRARNAGKESVAARTAWSLNIGHAHLRCVRVTAEDFELQIRDGNEWPVVATVKNPSSALRRVLEQDKLQALLSARIAETERHLAPVTP